MVAMAKYKKLIEYRREYKTYSEPSTRRISEVELKPTNAQVVVTQLKKYISDNDDKSLLQYLSTNQDFIHSVDSTDHKELLYDGRGSFKLSKKCTVEPLLEALFYDHFHLYCDLIELASKTTNGKIHEYLIKHMASVQFSSTDAISQLNDVEMRQLNTEIDNISAYKDGFMSDPTKGQAAKKLADEIKTYIGANQPVFQDRPTYTSGIKWLNFKLQVIKKLHTQDRVFATHRNSALTTVRDIVFNAVSILLLGGIPNLIRLAWIDDDNFLFSKSTKTQKLVDNADTLLSKNFSRW